MADGIYGAVPQALGETRRTLKDIMTDMAETRALEAKVKLTQGAQRGNLEIAKLESYTGLAKFQADSAFRSEQLAETTRHHKAIEGVAAPESKMMATTDTLRNWILRYPAISSAMKEVATKNMPEEELNQNMTGYEAKRLYDSLSKNPAFFYRNLKGTVIDKLDGIMAQLQDETVDEADREALYNEQYAPLHGHLEKLDLILGTSEKITDEELEGIRDMATEAVKASDGTMSIVDAMNEALESTKQIRKAIYSGKIFPDSLEEIMGKGATPGVEAGAGDDKGSWKTYDKDKPEKKKESKEEKKGPSLSETVRAPFTGLQDVETFQGYKATKSFLEKVREKGRIGQERMAGRGND